MDGVLEALRPHVTRNHLIISIAAGVRLASLEANLPEGTRVVRRAARPPLPCCPTMLLLSAALEGPAMLQNTQHPL